MPRRFLPGAAETHAGVQETGEDSRAIIPGLLQGFLFLPFQPHPGSARQLHRSPQGMLSSALHASAPGAAKGFIYYGLQRRPCWQMMLFPGSCLRLQHSLCRGTCLSSTDAGLCCQSAAIQTQQAIEITTNPVTQSHQEPVNTSHCPLTAFDILEKTPSGLQDTILSL